MSWGWGGGVHIPLESKDWWGYVSPQKARIGVVTFPLRKQGLMGLQFPLESKDWGVTFPLGKQGLVGLHFPSESNIGFIVLVCCLPCGPFSSHL